MHTSHKSRFVAIWHKISGLDWWHVNGGPTLLHSIIFAHGVSATLLPFCCLIFTGSADKGFEKRIQRLKECGDCLLLKEQMRFPGGSDGKVSACNVGDPVSIPGSGRTPGRGNGNPLQYSCLEDSVGREAWWAIFHGVTKSCT